MFLQAFVSLFSLRHMEIAKKERFVLTSVSTQLYSVLGNAENFLFKLKHFKLYS